MKVTIIAIMIGAFGTVTKGLLEGLEDLEVGGRDHQNNSIIQNGQNTKKSPGDRGDLLTQSIERPPANGDAKNSNE